MPRTYNKTGKICPHCDAVVPAPCGTESAYQRHIKRGLEPDGKCKAAHNKYTQERAAARELKAIAAKRKARK